VTGSKIIILRLSGRKNIVVYTSLVSLTISIMAVLIRLNKALISIVTSIISLRDRFSTTVRRFFIHLKNTGPANSVLDFDEYLTAVTL
jgi:hypothetical protein